MRSEITTDVAGEEVTLLPTRALYWHRAATLVIADPHFGKAAAFRASGVPVPEATTFDNLARLDASLALTGSQRLIVLGDFLHARAGRSEAVLGAISLWRSGHSDVEVLLVRGNHDDRAGDPPPEWGIECRDQPVTEGHFVWRHEPEVSSEGYVLAGHIHPAVLMVGQSGPGATLPCFYFGAAYGLVPAFGDFTGTAVIRPKSGDRVFVVVEDSVIEAR